MSPAHGGSKRIMSIEFKWHYDKYEQALTPKILGESRNHLSEHLLHFMANISVESSRRCSSLYRAQAHGINDCHFRYRHGAVGFFNSLIKFDNSGSIL